MGTFNENFFRFFSFLVWLGFFGLLVWWVLKIGWRLKLGNCWIIGNLMRPVADNLRHKWLPKTTRQSPISLAIYTVVWCITQPFKFEKQRLRFDHSSYRREKLESWWSFRSIQELDSGLFHKYLTCVFWWKKQKKKKKSGERKSSCGGHYVTFRHK